MPFIVGHVTARVDLNTLQFNIQSSNPALVDGVADLADLVFEIAHALPQGGVLRLEAFENLICDHRRWALARSTIRAVLWIMAACTPEASSA